MGKITGTESANGVHRLAREYVDSALKIQETAGSPSEVSSEDYDAAVERAEAALRDLVPA